MLYELSRRGNFFVVWLALTVMALALMMLMSGALFLRYYWRPSFETWQRKSNPQYPKPAMVRREVLQMVKGLCAATLCPAIALQLVDYGWSQAYGGLGGHGWVYLVLTFFVAWIGSDISEWAYHRIGHTRRFWW